MLAFTRLFTNPAGLSISATSEFPKNDSIPLGIDSMSCVNVSAPSRTVG